MANTFTRIAKPLLLTVMALLLLIVGLLVTLYSGWAQDSLRVALLEKVNKSGDVRITLDSFRLWFPLRVELEGLSVVQNGDSVVAVGSLDGRVGLMSLLSGQVQLDSADVAGVYFRSGSRDSASCTIIRAGNAHIAPASVRFKDMKIRLEKGALSDASVDLYINPNPPKKPASDSEPSSLSIEVGHLDISRLNYRMSLLPTIDSLGLFIDKAVLADASIDMLKQSVEVQSLKGHGLNATYIVPDSATIANTVVAPPDSTASAPWTVNVREFYFDKSAALYTTRGVKPVSGLDFAYISVDDVTLDVNNFYNRATTVRVPLNISATERCGVSLDVDGTLGVDSVGIDFKDFNLKTAADSRLAFSGFLGTGDLMGDPTVPLRLNVAGALASADARAMFPAFRAYLAPMAAQAAIGIDANVAGNMGKLNISKLAINVAGGADLKANGYLADVLSPKGPNGDIRFIGSLGNVNPYLRALMTASGLNVPPMEMNGNISFVNGNYDGKLLARTGRGDIALDGYLHGRGNVYSVDLDVNNFPGASFMPSLGVGNVTAKVTAQGHGFDFLSPATELNADVDLRSLVYQGETYSNLSATVKLADGEGHADITSANRGLDFNLIADARILPDSRYEVSAKLDGRDIDLYALKVMPDAHTNIVANGTVNATFDKTFTDIDAVLRLDDLSYVTETDAINVDDVTVRLNAVDTLVNASVRNRDLYAFFSAPMGIDSIASKFAGVSAVLDRQVAEHRVSVIEVQKQLPAFRLDIDAGDDNLITQILSDADASFASMTVQASNDSVINLSANALDVAFGTTKLDTVTFNVAQHGERLDYRGAVNNRPGTFDAWAHVLLNGFFEDNKLGIKMQQHNIAGKMGFDIGANVSLYGDSLAVLHFDPLDPTIAYKPWTINQDNFLAYSFTHKHADANLRMHGQGSSLALYTVHAKERSAAAHGSDEDLVVELTDIKLQDWIAINPFAPPMRGELSANMRVNWQDKSLTGDGNASLKNFFYGKERVGDFNAEIDLLTKPDGLINADVALSVDGKKALTLKGVLNDSTRTTPFDLDLQMIHFPLATVNPFIPGVAKLTGTLNGSLDVSGDRTNPRLNGALSFDSATVLVDMLGSKLTISNVDIPVTDNIVSLKKFNILACNENPLSVNGTVDISSFANPKIRLNLDADNMLIVDTRHAPKGASVYGKAFIGLDAQINGDMRLLNVNADASILSGTNMTYVIPDGTDAIQNRSAGDMVKFVNFTDTTSVAKADSIAPPSDMMMNLMASLTIQGGTTLTVDLDAKGSNRVQLKSRGNLNYSMNPLNSGRMTGRLNIDGGFVRYSLPPVLSEKLFKFNEGSYVAFNGDVMNPLLDIHAVDEARANVTQSGQNSRLINFDVKLGVTGTLNHMNVAFDLATEDDATVANELATMSPQQRASAAMNLLVTNMYTGGGDTRGSANLGGNALYSFLTSQLNSWAANTIKGVDVSFGINQYDKTAQGSTAQVTQYSYRVSKSLFNDRFKIIVGGNYSTDDNVSQAGIANNLLSDVSIEYMLNKTGSMYVRIFRHTGFESILEGEITQTGVGFVYRRKIENLKSMFRWRRRKKDKKVPDLPSSIPVNSDSVGSNAIKPEEL